MRGQLGHRPGEELPVHGQGAAGGHSCWSAQAMMHELSRRISLSRPAGLSMRLAPRSWCRPAPPGAGVMGRRHLLRAHFVKVHVDPEVGRLPGGFGARESAAHDDQTRAHGNALPTPHSIPSKARAHKSRPPPGRARVLPRPLDGPSALLPGPGPGGRPQGEAVGREAFREEVGAGGLDDVHRETPRRRPKRYAGSRCGTTAPGRRDMDHRKPAPCPIARQGPAILLLSKRRPTTHAARMKPRR